jgi:hypothetical protein
MSKRVTPKVTSDITAPAHVQIIIRADGKTVWVNVDGICKLRICQIPILEVEDQRPKSSPKLVINESGTRADQHEYSPSPDGSCAVCSGTREHAAHGGHPG